MLSEIWKLVKNLHSRYVVNLLESQSNNVFLTLCVPKQPANKWKQQQKPLIQQAKSVEEHNVVSPSIAFQPETHTPQMGGQRENIMAVSKQKN